MPIPTTIRVRAPRALAVAAVGLLAVAGTASASSIDTSVVTTTASGIKVLETAETQQTCKAPRLLQAFASLGDTRDYVLAPGGSFEDDDLDGWQVQKAKIGGDGSTLEVADDDNDHSLTVPAGGSATSPAMCVDLHYPTFRLMTKAKKGVGQQLKVELVYPDSDNPVFHPVGELTAGNSSGWKASADMPVFPERGGANPGKRRVALRFTSMAGTGAANEWRIDDLYVDPKRL